MELNGKVAIVTGGAAGIGKAIATTLAERGASVITAILPSSSPISYSLPR